MKGLEGLREQKKRMSVFVGAKGKGDDIWSSESCSSC
jgi:hypothetical protein